MTKFFDVLKNVLKKNNESGQEFAPLVKVEGADDSGKMPNDNNGQMINNPNIQPMRNGGLGTKLGYYAKKSRNKLFEALMGKSAEPTDNISGLNITVSNNPRVGGIVNDLRNGYNENRNTAFDVKNWDELKKADGLNKGLAYRIGEGAGTLGRGLNRGAGAFGRFADTPLGRAVIMGGLVGATGGNGLEMLAYGSTTGLTNQQNRMKDKLYRNDLANQGIDVSGINGYINDNIYQTILESKQMQDNAQHRNMLLNNQIQNQQEMMELRKMEAQRQARQDQRDYNLNAQRLGLQARGLDLQEQKLNQDKKSGSNVANLQAVSQQLKRFEDSFKNMPNKFESNTLGRLRNVTGLQTKTEANFNSQRQLLFNKIARDLGGEKGVLSDQDIKRIEGALPSYTDSYVQKQAKMQAIYDLLNDRLSTEGGSLVSTGYNSPQRTNNGTTQVGKYKVRVK